MTRVSEFSLKDPWSYRYIIGAGALFGFLFYDYFYAWTFALAFLGCLTLTALAWRKWREAIVAISISCIGLILGAYALYNLFSLYTSDLGKQMSYFFMTIYSHAFIGSTTGIAVLILFAIYWYFHRSDKNNFFLLAIILAGWVALEQQMVTGRAVQYGHYYWYFVVPLSIIVSLYISVKLIPGKWRWMRRWLCVAVILASFINTIGGQYKSLLNVMPSKLREQDFAPIIKKLQQEPKGVVLGDPGGTSYPFLVTIYTDDDLYWLPAATTSAFPMSHLKEALLVYLYINKDASKNPIAYLQKILSSTTSNAYADMYEQVEGFESGILRRKYEKVPFPHTDPDILAAREKFLPTVGNEYQSLTESSKRVRSALEQRGVRYILWDKRERPEWDLSVLGPLTVLATSTDITLYLLATTK